MGTTPEAARHGEDGSFEAQLRRAEANFLHILDSTSDAIVVHRENRIVYVNPAALHLFGYAREDVIGRSPFDFVSPRFRLMLAERILQTYVRHAVASEIEERLISASGREVPVEVIAFPILFGGELATMVHIRDISKRRELEVKLRTADRLANVGLLAASVAHEVNSPLTYALWNLELVGERLKSPPRGAELDEIRQLVAVAREGVERAARVARDMRMFSTAERRGSTRVDVHRLLDSCARLVRSDMRGRVRIVKSYGDVPPVLGNETRLAQIFLNLVANAVQSVPEGSDRTVEVRIETRRERDRVVVTIADDGVGIPEDLRETVFDPLFTTKTRGTGLGLSIARALIGEEHGTLSFDSKVGVGTTFRVTLLAASGIDAPVASGPPRERTRGRRILVVDDEPRLASTLEMILDAHETTTAATGREALERIRRGERYDVVLCDLVVDDLDGPALWARLREERPGLEKRMIFMTGAAWTPRAAGFLASVSNRRLEKPFEPEELLDAVDDLVRTET